MFGVLCSLCCQNLSGTKEESSLGCAVVDWAIVQPKSHPSYCTSETVGLCSCAKHVLVLYLQGIWSLVESASSLGEC